jgi:DMSO/TMAO reductase YedYZ molybdopterin-dependent catalytic subunit
LAALLEKAGVQPGAIEVILEGADKGQVNADPKSPGPIHFARSIPLAKAKQPEVLLAHTMNGATLPTAHGYPVRAVVGGWYGMAAVKWVTRIIVSKTPFQGFWQSLDYSYFVRQGELPTLQPLTVMQPKALIARPSLNEVVSAGKPTTIFGAAWAGEKAVKTVEVSTDGGTTWAVAKLRGEAKPMEWVLWEFPWTNPRPGTSSLVARATDTAGATQPTTRDPDRRSYMINHLVPFDVIVK